jgi:hypothetical protein
VGFVGDLANRNISHISFFGQARVPEPGTLMLLGAGLVGTALLRRRQM